MTGKKLKPSKTLFIGFFKTSL